MSGPSNQIFEGLTLRIILKLINMFHNDSVEPNAKFRQVLLQVPTVERIPNFVDLLSDVLRDGNASLQEMLCVTEAIMAKRCKLR